MKKFKLAALAVATICSLSVTITPAHAEWHESNGRWWYSDSSFIGYATDLSLIDDEFYYFDKDGWMVTGWQEISGEWYYFDSSGKMTTGWVLDSGRWYYLDAFGVMLSNTITPDGYWLGEDGAMIALQDSNIEVIKVEETTEAAETIQVEEIIQTEEVSAISSVPFNGYTIIVNTNTKKYHVPGCRSVKTIKSQNIGYSNNESYLIAHSYSPCKICH